MKKYLLGEKVGMTQMFAEDGKLESVTVVKVEPSVVVHVTPVSVSQQTPTVTLGYKQIEEKKLSKPELGRFKAASVSPRKVLRSFKIEDPSSYSVNQDVSLATLDGVDCVDVTGVSIGKGFAGTIKRHNFKRGPRSHGSKNYRAPGSIGAGTTPGRVLKGKRMAGHMGARRVTMKGLKVVRLDVENGLIFLKGSVPGKKRALVEISAR